MGGSNYENASKNVMIRSPTGVNKFQISSTPNGVAMALYGLKWHCKHILQKRDKIHFSRILAIIFISYHHK